MTPARRAGLARAARRASSRRLNWPELRANILRQGGIGPSPDYDAADWQALGLFRQKGQAPDLVAAETTLGRADRPPWQGSSEYTGDPDAMMEYLREARHEYQEATAQEREANKAPLGPRALARRRELAAGRAQTRRHEFGTARPATATEQGEHSKRMRAFLIAARAQRRARREAQYDEPATGFYTDENDEVHPITHRPMSRAVRARLQRGAKAAGGA